MLWELQFLQRPTDCLGHIQAAVMPFELFVFVFIRTAGFVYNLLTVHVYLCIAKEYLAPAAKRIII